MTSFVDLDTGRPDWLLALVPGPSGATVEGWLAAQHPAWRDGIEVVALDPSAPFAGAIRRLLLRPRSWSTTGTWYAWPPGGHRGAAAGRPRTAGPRGGTSDRRVRTGDCCPPSAIGWGRGLTRLHGVLAVDDHTNEIGAAWGVKDKEMLAPAARCPTAHNARQRLFRFYVAVLAADMPETTRLAETVQSWWPRSSRS